MELAVLILALGGTFAVALGVSRLLLELMLSAMAGQLVSPVGTRRRWMRRG